MNLRGAVTPFALGLFKHKGTWRRTSGSWCKFEPYGFPETSKKEEDKPSKIYRRFGPRSDSFVKFSTANVCPAVVIVSAEKRNGGSGIIIDSNGTVLTHARNIFSPDFNSKINVSLHDRRKFSGTILEVNEDHELALLKIQSEIPLPTTMFGSLGNYKARELISIHRLIREKAYPRTSSQNEVDEEDNLMLVDEEFKSTMDYEKFSLGCGGPIATLDGEVVVGISTEIDIIYPHLCYSGSYGTINAMGIEEALSKVGYPKKMILGIINR
ncbi:putative protease Do-like 14 isoform X2 [Dendrobium catenatum]|uniref:Protease Do-like 14 n=1 Tax=Dendrobium catenatum TaxID=906689 RepID=A0A2I0WNX5_9ASPA|nr:putative protease Do-like 14 isoform X2 [Dendrobium catenatum]PKU77362.1 Putative protease Do-like 14 [Dendrobium catenatum]